MMARDTILSHEAQTYDVDALNCFSMVDSLTLTEAAVLILKSETAETRATRTRQVAKKWREGIIASPHGHQTDIERRCQIVNQVSECNGSLIPEGESVPLRWRNCDQEVHVSQYGAKRGKGRTLASRQRILHALVHVESKAVELAWDIIVRFGESYSMPLSFFDDFVTVAEDEARHYSLLRNRLNELGSDYGAIEVQDGLWESAIQTSNSLPARLAIEHCVHEARGLDVLPQTISRLQDGGDNISAQLLKDIILPEEISHCAIGLKWFKFLYERDGPRLYLNGKEDNNGSTNETEYQSRESNKSSLNEGGTTQSHQSVTSFFHTTVRNHFRGLLKPPFNEEARSAAGFTTEWYLPLAQRV